MKKLFLPLLVTLVLFPTNILAKEYFIEFGKTSITEEQYNRLHNIGFEDNEIYGMRQDEFNANKDIVGHVVSKKVIDYSKIPCFSLDPEKICTFGSNNINGTKTDWSSYVETQYKLMTTYIIDVGSVNRYRFKVTLHWKRMPSTRSWDIIGIGHLSDVYVPVDAYMNESWCFTNGVCESTSAGYYYSYNQGEIAVMDLPSGSLSSLDSYMYYYAYKADPNSTITLLRAFGDYSHATDNVSPYPSSSVLGMSGEIWIYSNYYNPRYDEIGSADVNVSVNW